MKVSSRITLTFVLALCLIALGYAVILGGLWLVWPPVAIVIAGIGSAALGIGLIVEVD